MASKDFIRAELRALLEELERGRADSAEAENTASAGAPRVAQHDEPARG
jgi:hypothetical protein